MARPHAQCPVQRIRPPSAPKPLGHGRKVELAWPRNGEAGPKGAGDVVTFLSPAYDAGSEANDEDCDGAIPGPPGVCSGAAVSPPAATDEGYVHIHAGIHGVGGELDPAVYDWRNPVALVQVRRIGGAP